MDNATIQRYQPGGDIYNGLEAKYGTAAANAAANAALSGDRTQVTAALTSSYYGPPLDTSTLNAFVTQIETNPLGAPLAGLNNIFGNTIASLLKSPWIWGTALFVLFVWLGGLNWLKRMLNK